VSKKKLRDLGIKVNDCRSLMVYAPESETEGMNLKVGQWVTVIGACGKAHAAYVNNYDSDFNLWFFMIEREVLAQ
jgi:hypothetical protein